MVEKLVDDLREKALENKDDIKREKVELLIGDDVQEFIISGIGAKTIKLEKYVRYEDIVNVTEDGREGLESSIKSKIEEFSEK
ncbi:MAG: hypothetical protein LBM96_01260 [Methanobrevibacter sp.]|jgi:hypothetical protein|nr:hypothetical protein [Candidatus Methanoflexus mossambicus]